MAPNPVFEYFRTYKFHQAVRVSTYTDCAGGQEDAFCVQILERRRQGIRTVQNVYMKNQGTSYFLQLKDISGYLFLFVLAAIVLGSLSVFSGDADTIFWLVKSLQLLAFLCLGTAHTKMVEKGLPFLDDKFQSRLSFSAVVTGSICVILLIWYAFTNSSMLFMALASSCAFFIPYTIRQLWNVYKKIPETRSMAWYGFTNKLDQPDIVYLSSIPVTFKLAVSQDDDTAMSFSIKAPLHMELSKLFNLFVLAAEKNYDIRIDSADENNRFYGWQFFAEYLKGLLNVQINPNISVGDNKDIKPDGVIFVKRVRGGAQSFSPVAEAIGTPNVLKK